MGAGIKTGLYRVEEGESVDLSRWPPGILPVPLLRGAGPGRVQEAAFDLEKPQVTHYAEHKHKVLVIFEAMDTGEGRHEG
jgi:hypothetical protein